MWLSVDPMADKYPSISPYAYCAWNSVKLVDPDGLEALENDDWVKNNKTGQYEWNDFATSPTTTPQGYTYVGDDLELLADLNIQTKYNRQHCSRMGHSPNQGSNYVGFDRSVNSTEAYLFVSVRVRNDEHNVTIDNPLGKTFDGIDITCNVNQWSRNSAGEPNSMTFNGNLIVDGNRGFHSQSSFREPTGPTIYATGTIPMRATVSIPAHAVYRNNSFRASISLGHASASTMNRSMSFYWSIMK